MINIIHYNQKEGMFILHKPGYGPQELIDKIILKDAVFFVAPSCQDIIRDRSKTMSKSLAKFPHAFAISTSIEPNLDILNDSNISWRGFEYDVFRHNSFVLVDTQEPIYKVKYLFINKKELKVVL